MDFGYASEKFSTARHMLMLPHSSGEDASIADAFHEISLCLHGADIEAIEDIDTRQWIQKLQQFMNTEGLDDPSGVGTYRVKARGFTTDDKIEISRLVDDLAYRLSATHRGDF